MKKLLALLLLVPMAAGGCQLTKDDFLPFHLRKGGGEAIEQPKPEPKTEPKPEPTPEIKEVIYAIGLKGID